jgi:predicted MarR family transcription regulator
VFNSEELPHGPHPTLKMSLSGLLEDRHQLPNVDELSTMAYDQEEPVGSNRKSQSAMQTFLMNSVFHSAHTAAARIKEVRRALHSTFKLKHPRCVACLAASPL